MSSCILLFSLSSFWTYKMRFFMSCAMAPIVRSVSLIFVWVLLKAASARESRSAVRESSSHMVIWSPDNSQRT